MVFNTTFPTINLLALTLIFTLISSVVSAQVYKTVDKDGNVIYTDQPTPNSVPVDVRDPNTLLPIEATPRVTNVPTQKVAVYTSLEITSPANESIIPNGLVPFTVSADIQPELIKGHALQLMVNGEFHSERVTGNFPIPFMYRGSRKLQVNVVNRDKKIIQQSPVVTIQVYTPKRRGNP